MKSTEVIGHPDDARLLDSLNWSQPAAQPRCDRCGKWAATAVVGWVDSGSGPGYDIRNCRPCLALYLQLARSAAERRGLPHSPSLPRYH